MHVLLDNPEVGRMELLCWERLSELEPSYSHPLATAVQQINNQLLGLG